MPNVPTVPRTRCERRRVVDELGSSSDKGEKPVEVAETAKSYNPAGSAFPLPSLPSQAKFIDAPVPVTVLTALLEESSMVKVQFALVVNTALMFCVWPR